jgi:hypothetical protein
MDANTQSPKTIQFVREVMKIVDLNEEKTFHPSLDVKDDILVIGFRIKREKSKESDLFFIRTSEQYITTGKPEFRHKGETFSIEKRKRVLPKLSHRWGVNKLNGFLERYQDPLDKFNERELYQKVKETIRRYVELEQEADYIILTAWTIGTYFFPIFSAYPYIHIKAPKGSGKSQCLNLLNQMAFNAVKARASFPALRDTVDSLRGTYLMDQADALRRNNMGEILDVLTDSYKRAGGNVRKMIASKNDWHLEEFEAYSPKAFASIYDLPEDLRDRCIVIPLVRSEINYPPVNEEDDIWKEIRNGLYTLLIKQSHYVSQVYAIKKIEYRESNEIFGRQLELWLPIEVILKSIFAGDEEVKIAKERFLSRYNFSSYQTTETEMTILETIMILVKDENEVVLRPKEIALKVDTESLDDEDGFSSANQRQKSTIVGRAINKFNLATQKLTRDSRGERYLFSKEHLEKIHKGYFDQQTPEFHTQTTTEPKNKDAFDDYSE